MQMIILSKRNRSPELMDDLTQPPREIETALAALSRMNTLSLTARILAKYVRQQLGASQQVRILDLGSGGGDVLCAVVRILLKRGISVDAIGVDLNKYSVSLANLRASRLGVPVSFVNCSALEATATFEYDTAISSLFLHHLRQVELVSLLRNVKQRARVGMVMTDLKRSAGSYALVWAVTRTISSSRMVRLDGLTSVKSALTVSEFATLARIAGLPGMQVRPCFPSGLMLTWRRTGL